MTKRVRIQWSKDEWDTVLMAARGHGAPEVGDTEAVWRAANLVLPPERRRAGNSNDWAKMNAERRGKGRPKAAQGEAAPPEHKASATPAPPAPVVEVEETPALPQQAARWINEVLMAVLYEPQLRTALRDLIKETLAPETAEAVETGVLWRAPVVGQEKRRRVVIAAGGRFMAYQDVLRPLMRFYDLRFWDSRHENAARLRATLEGAQVCVIITNSVSHGGADTARAWGRAGKGQVVNFTRNINALADELPGLLGDEVRVANRESGS